MKANMLWLAPIAVAVGFAQSESAIKREGRYWVQTVTGTTPLEKSARLKVSTRGEVAIRGESREDVAYTLRKRVRVSSEEIARRELGRLGLKTSRQGEWTVLVLETPDRGRIETDLRLAVPRSLRETVVISQGGAVEAMDLDGSVRADTSGGHIDMDRIQGDLNVRTGGGHIRLGKIGGVVRCSSGGGSITADSLGRDTEFNTGGGEIEIREAAGPVRVATGGGNIQIERAQSLVATTGGGLIAVGQVHGQVVAETGAGAIKVGSARGVRCTSGAGAIQLHSVSGGLRASTGMGNILAELSAGQPFEDSTLSTASGDITVFIPSNLPVTVQAFSSGTGLAKIVSDFAEIQPRPEQRGAEARGTLNGGGPLLRLAASGGTVYIRRQK